MSEETESEGPLHLRRSEADVIEHELRTLEIGPPQRGRLKKKGAQGAVSAQLANGLWVVIKVGGPDEWRTDAVNNDVATYEVAKILGLSIVPPTVLRSWPESFPAWPSGEPPMISVRLHIEGDEIAAFTGVSDDDLCDAAALELATCQIDRLDNNWFVTHEEGQDRIHLIDNAASFDWKHIPNETALRRAGWRPGTPRSSVYDWVQAHLSGPNFRLLERLEDSAVARKLSPYLSPQQIENMRRRARGESAA